MNISYVFIMQNVFGGCSQDIIANYNFTKNVLQVDSLFFFCSSFLGKVEWRSFVKWTKISIRRRSSGSQMNADDYRGKVEGLLNERWLLSGEGRVRIVCQMNKDFFQKKVKRFSNECWRLSGEGWGIVEWTRTTIRWRSSGC